MVVILMGKFKYIINVGIRGMEKDEGEKFKGGFVFVKRGGRAHRIVDFQIKVEILRVVILSFI